MQKNNPVVDKHVLKTLLYFDIFNYPLKSNEVFRFLGMNSIAEGDVTQSLNSLVERKLISNFQEFYGLASDESFVQRRIKGNEKAKGYLPVAHRKALLIAKFPFVRAVLASGSLSKDYMDEKSDLDFFIITADQRLWIARTLLVMYKRIFLRNSHKHFCVNYFIDETHLEIEEKNQFTATELATVIPLYNPEAYQQLLSANPWLKKFFPNFQPRVTEHTTPQKHGLLKKFTETFLNLFSKPLEKFFMRLTLSRLKRIYGKHYSNEDFSTAFKTKKYTSKNHPKHFQRKVIDLHLAKLNEFSDKHNISLLS